MGIWKQLLGEKLGKFLSIFSALNYFTIEFDHLYSKQMRESIQQFEIKIIAHLPDNQVILCKILKTIPFLLSGRFRTQTHILCSSIWNKNQLSEN